MLPPSDFFSLCKAEGIRFYTGVPDSLLKDFCAYASDNLPPQSHVIAANEGGAVALATGHYLATGSPAVVYLQNSGQGNAINPLLSIAAQEVYGIPMLLLVGWRGEPGVHDEPQHVKQGEVTGAVFTAMGVPHEVLAEDVAGAAAQVARLLALAREQSRVVALLVRAGTFAKYSLKTKLPATYSLSREAVVGAIAAAVSHDTAIVATTGHISRELYETRARRQEGNERDFLTVGAMGHASQIALGIALAKPATPVVCIDGDGAMLMHMGNAGIVGQSGCANFRHVVLNNGAHGSVGGQPTVAFGVSLAAVAKAAGYRYTRSVSTEAELQEALQELCTGAGPSFLEVRVSPAARSDLGRPKSSPADNKRSFMGFLRGSSAS